jgi:hypothetical protein
MQPFISQALINARTADMLRQAQAARQAHDAKHIARRHGHRLAQVRSLRTASAAHGPERAQRPAA